MELKETERKKKKGRKEIFYLMMHSTHFHLQLYGKEKRKKTEKGCKPELFRCMVSEMKS